VGGRQSFGHFLAAFFTMFQCVTGDSWMGFARTLMQPEPEPQFSISVFFFFMSFMILISMVIVNAVMALLLDEFLSATAIFKRKKALAAFGEQSFTDLAFSLDPLLSMLATEVPALPACHSSTLLVVAIEGVSFSGVDGGRRSQNPPALLELRRRRRKFARLRRDQERHGDAPVRPADPPHQEGLSGHHRRRPPLPHPSDEPHL
jgi:hypothetical protein